MKWIYSAFYVAVTGFISYLIGEALPRKWFDENRFPYREFSWEKFGKIYDKFKIKKWKTKLIDMSKIMVHMISKTVKFNATTKQLSELIKETCVAEFIHLVLCLTSVGVYWIWDGITGVFVWILCIIGNIPYIMVQRYNRPHLKALREKMLKRQENRNLCHKSCWFSGGYMTDYKNFRLNKLNTPEYKHLLLLLYWPLYGILFLSVERLISLDYNYIHCFIDDMIPFCEFFVIPYYFWFIFLIGMLFYTLFFDTECFKKYMLYIIYTYTVAIIVYLVYPNAQQLRPVNFERDNVFTRIVSFLYDFDTNTNVCPSIHVLGSLAVMFASFHTKRFKAIGWRIFFIICTVLISVSTVFLKQHSIIDVIFALPIGFVSYYLSFKTKLLLK